MQEICMFQDNPMDTAVLDTTTGHTLDLISDIGFERGILRTSEPQSNFGSENATNRKTLADTDGAGYNEMRRRYTLHHVL
jgi:hypothetical protein